MELIQLEKLEILLDNDKMKYQCGETISGTVNIALNGELELSRVNIVLRSMAEVKWVETCGNLYFREDYEYRDIEQNLNVAYIIPYNLRKTTITKGSHNIPFAFKLPDNIPSSIETYHGFIFYWIDVIINYGSFECDVYHNKKYFAVESPSRHDLEFSVGGATEKDVGILFLGSGKVRIDASIRKKGHMKGETVEVNCLVTNTSTVAVTPRARFYQLQIYISKERHETLGYSSDAVIGDKVNAGEIIKQTISVQLPIDIPLSMKTRMISIKYFIHVTLDIPHAFDLHLNLPIIITNDN